MEKIIGVFLMLFLLTGCTVAQTFDVEREYRDFWKYSLGDYTYNYEKKDDNGSNGSGGFRTEEWYEYTFEFKDINNRSRNITLSNSHSNVWTMEDNLKYAIEVFLNEELETIFESRSFQSVKGLRWLDIDNCSVERKDSSIDWFDSKKSIKFKDLSLETLKENNLKVEIDTRIFLDGNIAGYPNLKQILIDNFKFIFDKYGYSNISFKFIIDPSEDWYDTFYYLDYDGINYHWTEEYLGSPKNK